MSGVYTTERVRALIQAVLDTGESYQTIADRGGMKKSTVHAIATKKTRTDQMSDEMMQQLAKGLKIPYSKVLEAAVLDHGGGAITDEEQIPGAVLITEALKDMTPKKRADYIEMALALSKAYRKTS